MFTGETIVTPVCGRPQTIVLADPKLIRSRAWGFEIWFGVGQEGLEDRGAERLGRLLEVSICLGLPRDGYARFAREVFLFLLTRPVLGCPGVDTTVLRRDAVSNVAKKKGWVNPPGSVPETTIEDGMQ